MAALRVLCPLDGSERSFLALEKGLSNLAVLEPDVTLFAVQNGGFENAAQDIIDEFEDDSTDEIFPTEASCKSMLAVAKKRAEKVGVPVTIKLGKGKVIQEIVAASADYDVVLMHALNRSGFLEGLKLSGTEKIARRAQCSVLLVAD